MEERLAAAKVLADMIKYPVEIYVDQMANEANFAFAAIPERLAILLDNKIEFIGGEGPFDYSIPAAIDHLKKLL